MCQSPLQFLAALPPIPKQVHMTWKVKDIADDPSPLIQNGLRNIIDMNPDWQVTVSDDADLERYLQARLSADDYRRIQDRHIVEKCDLWRLLKLFHEGGLYQDIDRPYNIPLRRILTERTRCVLPTYYDIDFTQAFMLSAPGNPIFRRAIELNLERRRQGCTDILSLGPITYFHAVTEHLVGEPLQREPGADVMADLRRRLADCELTETHRETPPEQGISFRRDPSTWRPGNGESKDAFYARCATRHWMVDAPDDPGNKPYGR